MLKSCSKCKVQKRLSDFRKDSNRKDGLQNYCRDCHNAANKLWRTRNREKHLTALRDWHEKNREHSRKSNATWAKNHPELRRLKDAKRRRMLEDAGDFLILESEIRRLYASPCAICGNTDNVTADHVMPLSRGGRHSIGNLQPLCKPCNSSKKDKLMSEWRYRSELVALLSARVEGD
jgi:5-methylcytosine-specific restriction endonuclease McrA